MDTILDEESAAKTLNELGMGSLERLFPGFKEDSSQQATLSAGQPGTGCKRSLDVARPGALERGYCIAARPWRRTSGRTTLLTRRNALVENAAAAFLETLDNSERATAHISSF